MGVPTEIGILGRFWKTSIICFLNENSLNFLIVVSHYHIEQQHKSIIFASYKDLVGMWDTSLTPKF